MGISYQIDTERRVVLIRWEGPVDRTCLKAHWETITADDEAMACCRSLADLRSAEFCFTGAELDRIVQTVLRPGLRGRRWRSAILVAAPVQVGVSRQYAAFSEEEPEVCTFTEEGAARAWLGL